MRAEIPIGDNVVGRVEREDRPPHRPIMRVFSGAVEPKALYGLSQMATGVPVAVTVEPNEWEKVFRDFKLWMLAGGIDWEREELWPFKPVEVECQDSP